MYSLLGLAAWLGWRNLRSGRGDARGAGRLAVFIFLANLLEWVFTFHRTPTLQGLIYGPVDAIGWAVLRSAMIAALYLALEPYVRRRWPQSMISWTRLLNGGFRDPLVGGHVLVGLGVGVVFLLTGLAGAQEGSTFGTGITETVLNTPAMAGAFINALRGSIAVALGLFFTYFLIRSLLRKDWLSITMIVVPVAGPAAIAGRLSGVFFGLLLGSFILVLTRFGVLPFIVAFWVNLDVGAFPLTTDFSVWYAGANVFILTVFLAITAFAFHTAIAGRPLFKPGFLDPD